MSLLEMLISLIIITALCLFSIRRFTGNSDRGLSAKTQQALQEQGIRPEDSANMVKFVKKQVQDYEKSEAQRLKDMETQTSPAH